MPITFIALLGSALFGWHAWRGLRKGEVRLPVQLLEFDEYDREHTLFWGIVGLNMLLSIVLLVLAIVAYVKGWG